MQYFIKCFKPARSELKMWFNKGLQKIEDFYKENGSHFILSGLNYYVLSSKNKYNVLIVFILYCKALLLLLRCDTG